MPTLLKVLGVVVMLIGALKVTLGATADKTAIELVVPPLLLWWQASLSV